MPALAAPLRTPAEHDRITAAQEDWPIACAVDGPQDSGGAVLVLGFRHTTDPADPQITALRAQFSDFAPTLVLVEGRLEYSTREAKGGGKRSKLEVIVENFEFLGGRTGRRGGTEGEAHGNAGTGQPDAGGEQGDYGEIPF